MRAGVTLVDLKPDIFVAALAEGYLHRHPEAAARIVRERLGHDPAYLAKIWVQHDCSLTLQQSLVTAMQDQAQRLIERGRAPGRERPDFSAALYVQGLESIKPGSVSVVR